MTIATDNMALAGKLARAALEGDVDEDDDGQIAAITDFVLLVVDAATAVKAVPR